MTMTFLVIGFIYLITIGILLIGNIQLEPFTLKEIPSDKRSLKTGFSIIVPFRNEAGNLPELMKSIKDLDYPTTLFEVILVDDHSEDDSLKIITDMIVGNVAIDIKVITNQRRTKSPKKDAITTAVNQAKFEWILTTDADCVVPKKWLKSCHYYINKFDPKLIAGPVLFRANSTFIQTYQQIDGLSLQGVTMGGFGLGHPILCNGANLGYLKSIFMEVNGFTGNDHLASGDDIFILEKIRSSFPDDCRFVRSKDAIIQTKPVSTWDQCIDQRIRWASKTTQQKNIVANLIGIIVFLENSLFILGGILSLFYSDLFVYYLLLVLSKLLIDIVFLKHNARFFGLKLKNKDVVRGLFLYPWVTSLVVLKSLRGTYRWKGRDH